MPDQTRETRFIFITGGVVSSLGKGIAAAAIGRLLVARGLSVQIQKFDPYINVDPGTMSPSSTVRSSSLKMAQRRTSTSVITSVSPAPTLRADPTSRPAPFTTR